MASVKSIITPVEKNPDGTIRQKAIVTGAIPKRAQATNLLPNIKLRKPVTITTTPRRSGFTQATARSASKLCSGLTPIRPKPMQKLKSGLMPIRPCLVVEAGARKQDTGLMPIKTEKKMVTIKKETTKSGANSTFEIPQQKKTTTTHCSSCINSQRNHPVNTKQSNAAQRIIPNNPQRPVAAKISAPKMTTRAAITYATRRRRSDNFGATGGGTPKDKKGKSRIPVPINPNQVTKHVKQIEESLQYLMKREKELMDELAEVRRKLALRQSEKFKESVIRSVGANALPIAFDSPTSAFNLRPPSRSSTLKKPDERITVDILAVSRDGDLNFSAYCNTPNGDDMPVDVLLSVSKSKTPGSLFENYRRNCATLRSPSCVKRVRRSRSLSTHRLADGENSISERVLVQLNSLYR